MRTTHIALTVSLMLVSALVGTGVGYYLTPEYRLAMYDTYGMDLGTADRWLDLRYLNAMIAHHRGAMLLAEQAQSSERQEVRDLAATILASEPKLIAELYTWKREWYGDTRFVRDPLVPHVGEYDDSFDLRFLNALIAHHETGVRMTEDVRRKSSRSQVLDNADAVQSFLTTSGALLKGWRAEWYSL